MVMDITPRCLAGLTPEVLLKLRRALIERGESDTELKEAIDRLVEMLDEDRPEVQKLADEDE